MCRAPGQDGAREQKGSGRVDAQVALPERGVGLGERRRLGDARVVDEDVDRAEARGDRGDAARDRALVGHVEHERECLDAEADDRGRRRGDLIGRSCGDGDLTAFSSQRQRDLTTDAAAGAGDEGDRLRGRPRHGLSTQNRKKRGRLPDASSRAGSVRQRTRGVLLLLRDWPLVDDADAQPASATNSSRSTTERRRRFMRPFYRGIRYI